MIPESKLGLMTVVHGLNILWAGVPGLLILFFPDFARRQMLPYMVGDVPQDPLTVRILGSIWLSVGLVSLYGLSNPLPVAGVFVVQILYKILWIGVAVLPALVRGETRALPLALGFVVMIVAAALATPWGYFLRAEQA